MQAEQQEKRSKFERTSQEQLQFFISFCKDHPELQRGKFQPTNPQLIQNLWAEVADTLNSMRGPTRTVAKWKESLMHWKHQLRSRARRLKAQPHVTGGGPLIPDISEFEQQAIDTFGAAAVDGISGVSCTLGHAVESSVTIVVDETIPSANYESPATTSCFVLPATAGIEVAHSASATSASIHSDDAASGTATSVNHSATISSHGVLPNVAVSSAVSSPTVEGKLTVAKVLNSVMAKVEAREKRDEQFILHQERIITQNENLANALMQATQALNTISQALNKLTEKLDTVYGA